MNEPLFLSEADVLWLHARVLEQHGGMDGLRDPGAFASALHAPEAVWHYVQGDLFELAAAYAFHLAQNQPFIDGNKRVAVAAAISFLELNGLNTSSCPDRVFYDAMIAIAEKRLDKAGLAAVFRAQLASCSGSPMAGLRAHVDAPPGGHERSRGTTLTPATPSAS